MPRDFLRFLKDLRFSGKAENTYETYRVQLERYFAFLKKKRVDYRATTNKELREFRDWLAKQGKSPATINLALSAIRAFYEFLLFDGVIQGNPVSKKLNVKEPEHLPDFLSKEEEQTAINWLRNNTPAHIALAFETMQATGIRVSEAAALTGADVLRMDGKIFLRIRSGKGQKERYAPVLKAEVAQKLLTLALERQGKSLFGVIASTLKGYAFRCKRATSVDFRSHRLRHTVGTSLLSEGVPLDVIQQVLGHANIATTRVYAATLPEKIMALAANID